MPSPLLDLMPTPMQGLSLGFGWKMARYRSPMATDFGLQSRDAPPAFACDATWFREGRSSALMAAKQSRRRWRRGLMQADTLAGQLIGASNVLSHLERERPDEYAAAAALAETLPRDFATADAEMPALAAVLHGYRWANVALLRAFGRAVSRCLCVADPG